MKTVLREFARASLSALLVITFTGTGIVVASNVTSGGNALKSLGLNQFATTTSAQFFGVISDETGSGAVVGASGPTLQGTVTATGNVNITGNVAINGTLGVTGAITAKNITLVSASGNGLTSTGNGASAGVSGTGGSSSGAGVYGVGGAGAGNGGDFTATGTGIGAIGRGSGTSQLGLYAFNLTGPALYVLGDTSSPVRAPAKVEPVNAQPSGASTVGDFYISSLGVPVMNTVAGTPGTWTPFSNLGIPSTVAATGADETDDTEISATADWVTVTAANGTKGVGLPAGSTAKCVRVMTQVTGASNTLKVYAASADDSDSINGVDGDTAYVQMAGTSLVYCTADGAAWFTY